MAASLTTLGALAAAGEPTGIGVDAEETFELKMERVLVKDGEKALALRLQQEVARDPRPYAVAWLATYQLYGDLKGMPELHDEAKGLAAAEQARASGCVFAKEVVGRALVDGRGLNGQRKPKDGALLLREAADAGRYTAMGELAKLYFYGYGVPRDDTQAELWARRASYRGYPEMLYFFGQWTEAGQAGHSKDIAKACDYYYESALRGYRRANERLAALGNQGIPKAQMYAHLWLLDGALRGVYYSDRKISKAAKALEKEWSANPMVLVTVARIRMDINSPVYDPKLAWEYLDRARQKGNTDAHFYQAEMIREGIGRKKDPALAIQLYRQLADAGNASALGRLGWLCYWGSDTSGSLPKDENKAFVYIRDAAHLGDVASVLNLAFLYKHGVGTPVNYSKAARYYSIAEDMGFIEARREKDSTLAFVKD